MELLCPHCQNRLNIADEFAGQLLKCTLCSGMFQAPALQPPPPAPPPPIVTAPPPPVAPAPPPPISGPAAFKLLDVPGSETPPAAAPTPSASAPPSESAPSSAPAPGASPTAPPAPSLDGYKHVYTVTFKKEVITWIAPGGLALLFLLSFFPWSLNPTSAKRAQRMADLTAKTETPAKGDTPKTDDAAKDIPKEVLKTVTDFVPRSASPWSLAFLGHMTSFVLYIFFFILTAVVAILSVLLDKKIVTLPDPLKKIRPYRALIVAGMATIGFLFIFFHWITFLFDTISPTSLWFSIALRVHFLVIVGALLDYWLQRRKKNELPIPKIEMRW